VQDYNGSSSSQHGLRIPKAGFMYILGLVMSLVVVLKKMLKKQIAPFALNFECSNIADIVYAQTARLHTN